MKGVPDELRYRRTRGDQIHGCPESDTPLRSNGLSKFDRVEAVRPLGFKPVGRLCQPEGAVERLLGMKDSVAEEMLTMGGRGGGWRGGAMDPARAVLADVLFRRHYAALLRLGVVMLGSREAAEDAVQDAFVALHRHSSALRDPEAAEAYLRSAVLNRCRSWVRGQATQRAPRQLVRRREHQEGPEDTTVGRDEFESLVAVMRTLARRQREVLACRYVLELSIEETAQLLQISGGSVKTHAHRGLHALQQRIEMTQ